MQIFYTKKSIILLIIILFFYPWYAQTQDSKFFICPLTEILGSRNGPAIGGGISIGAGDDVTMGTRVMFFTDSEGFNSLEIGVFLRLFPFDGNIFNGLFFQLNGGAVVFVRDESVSLPTDVGTISAFVSAGWRFLLGNRFFVEPSVRIGTPYIFGGGVSAGIRF